MSENPARQLPSARRAITGLTTINVLVALGGLLTGPIQAHALGATGRGHLAAVLTPVQIASWLAMVGQGAFISRRAASGEDRGRLLASSALLFLPSGILVAICSPLVVRLLVLDSPTTASLLLLGLVTIPILQVGYALYDLSVGAELWRVVVLCRALPTGLATAGVVTLALLGRLDLITATATWLIANVIGLVPGVVVLRSIKLRVRTALLRAGVSFGSRAVTQEVLNLANGRLDQLLMIPLVPAAGLGHYVVAVTVAQVAGLATSAVAVVALPRAARRDRPFIGVSLRLVLTVNVLVSACAALTVPWGVPLVFGSDFESSVPLAWILLAANVPLAGLNLLVTVLTGLNRPGLATIGQSFSAAITVIGLLALLPSFGPVAAAWISLTSYSVAFAVLALFLKHETAIGIGEMTLLRSTDARAALAAVGRIAPRLRDLLH